MSRSGVGSLKAPQITDLMTVPQVAEALSVSRQAVTSMMKEGVFESLGALGDSRPIYVVKRDEVLALKAARKRRRVKAAAEQSVEQEQVAV